MMQSEEFGGRDWNSLDSVPAIDMGISALLYESPELFVRISRVSVHENSITLHVDGGAKATWPGKEAMRNRKDQIGVSVAFADGRSARLNDSVGLKSGLGPLVTWAGGTWRGRDPVGDEYFDLSLRIWPLPPPGPLTITFAWPDIGMDDAVVVIDGERARSLGGSLGQQSRSDSVRKRAQSTPATLDHEVVVPNLVEMEVHSARSFARRIGLFLEYPDADGPPLASGIITRQEPVSGEVVRRFTPIKAWVRDAREGPPPRFRPDNPDDGGGPAGGVREPRRPMPHSGEGLAELAP
jgi:hypothetical protein